MQCFLCSKAKAIIGQVRQSSGRTAKPRAAGPGMLLPLPGKAKKDGKVSYLRSLDVQRRASNDPTHSQPCKGAHRKKQVCLMAFYDSPPQSSSDWFIQELQVQGRVGVFPPFHDVNRILGKTTCHCMEVKKIWVKSGLSLLKIYQSHLEVTATLSNNTRC